MSSRSSSASVLEASSSASCFGSVLGLRLDCSRPSNCSLPCCPSLYSVPRSRPIPGSKGEGSMTLRDDSVPGPLGRDPVSRRRVLAAASAGIAGTVVTGRATADTLADVAPRDVGADLSGHSERSKYVHIDRVPEAGPGRRNIDPSDAINSKPPLDKLVGAITPSDLHYERSHSGVPELDPAKHPLLIHRMTRKNRVVTVDDLKAMPSVSRIVFIECTGNGWENWKKADENLTVQNTHGLVSTNEWTGVPLRFVIRWARTFAFAAFSVIGFANNFGTPALA